MTETDELQRFPAPNLAEYQASQADANRSALRQKIAGDAGDTLSLLGTTADATHLLLYGVASLVAKLATANSLAEVREAAAPFAEVSSAFLAKVADGSVRLPMMAKPLESVVSDIERRATAVADALASVPVFNKVGGA